MTAKQLQALARKHGTPMVIIDHDVIRANYAMFRKHLPKVQAYYAVKANAEPAIVRTLYKAGASFDVASLPEFMLVYENIKHLPAEGAAGFHLGQDHLRQPHQTQGDAPGARPIQAAGDLRQPDGAEEDPAIRAARRRGAASARSQHGFDGGVVLQSSAATPAKPWT